MLHWFIVGHVDPLDPIDLTTRPYKPKVTRPIPKGMAEQLLDEFGQDVEPYVWYDDAGYVVCEWAQAPGRLWDRVQAFARLVAERQEATIMDEMFIIQWPEEARQVQQSLWANSS